MNPRIRLIEGLLQIDIDCDALIIKFEENKYSYYCLKEEGDDYKEVDKGDIIGPIADMIYNFCFDFQLQEDIAGSGNVYNRKNGLQILASIIRFPECKYEIVYHSDVDRGCFSDSFSEKIRNTFQVI